MIGALPETAGTLSLERITLPKRAPFAVPARRRLPLASTDIAPLATRAVSAAVVGLAVEYAFRTFVNGSVARLWRPVRRAVPAVRTVTTEVTIVERISRR